MSRVVCPSLSREVERDRIASGAPLTMDSLVPVVDYNRHAATLEIKPHFPASEPRAAGQRIGTGKDGVVERTAHAGFEFERRSGRFPQDVRPLRRRSTLAPQHQRQGLRRLPEQVRRPGDWQAAGEPFPQRCTNIADKNVMLACLSRRTDFGSGSKYLTAC